MIFSFDKSISLEGGSEKPCDDQGGLPKNERQNKEIIIAHGSP